MDDDDNDDDAAAADIPRDARVNVALHSVRTARLLLVMHNFA